MSKEGEDDDDSSLESGDLGLGLGLKPGSLPLLDVLANNTQLVKKTEDIHYPLVSDKPFLPPSQNHYAQVRRLRGSRGVDKKEQLIVDCSKDIRKKGIQCRKVKAMDDKGLSAGDPTAAEVTNFNKKDILKKLQEAEQEVEELKTELEVYEKRLDAKYKAIAILKQQMDECEHEHDIHDKRSRKYEESLEREVNSLNFELGKQETTNQNSQQLWAVRFDSICKENADLTAALEKKSNELRDVKSQKMALDRERDELLALLDVKERGRYIRSRSVSEDEAYSEYTSTELAVLGACKCRVTSPEPCGCAHAAANLRREICKIKEQCEIQKRRRDEAILTIDAYRAAFEEQLHKNKLLMLRLADLAVSGPSKYERAKVMMKNLIHLLNDDDYLTTITSQRQKIYSINGGAVQVKPEMVDQKDPATCMTDKELVIALTEILHQRNEAFAHKKVAAQVLTDKVKELENQLSAYQQEEVSS